MQQGGYQPQYYQQGQPQGYGPGGAWGGPPPRPAGVAVLGIIGIASSIFTMLLAVALGVGFLAFGGAIVSNVNNSGAGDLGRSVGSILAAGGVFLSVALFVLSLLSFFIARGLWNQRNWARLVYIVSSFFTVISSVLGAIAGLLSGQDGAMGAVCSAVPVIGIYLWIALYLMKRDVAAAFR